MGLKINITKKIKSVKHGISGRDRMQIVWRRSSKIVDPEAFNIKCYASLSTSVWISDHSQTCSSWLVANTPNHTSTQTIHTQTTPNRLSHADFSLHFPAERLSEPVYCINTSSTTRSSSWKRHKWLTTRCDWTTAR